MRPMVGGKIIKGQEFVTIFLKTLCGLGILESVVFQEQIKSFLRTPEINITPCRRDHRLVGLDWLRPFHDYRHFFCHYLINKGKADYVLVSKLASHKNPSMTLNYSSPSMELKQTAIESFDRVKSDFVKILMVGLESMAVK